MKDFIIVALMAGLVIAVAPKSKKCTSRYNNTLQHDIYRICY